MTAVSKARLDSLEKWGQVRRQHIAAAEEATAEVRSRVVDLAGRGVSEVRLAELAGVTRVTVRNWLGK